MQVEESECELHANTWTQAIFSGVTRTELFYARSGKILKTMPRIASQIGATLKGKNLPPKQIFSFKSSPYGKKAKIFMLMAPYYKYVLTHVTRMRNVRNERSVYAIVVGNH